MKKRYQDLMHLGFNEVVAKAAPLPFSTIEQIAEQMGVSVEEMYRWLKSREQAKEPR